MELKDIIREKLLAETLADRDGTIISLFQENQKMKREREGERMAQKEYVPTAQKDEPDEG